MDRTSDPTKIVKVHLIRQDRRWMFLGISLVRKSQGREEESENTDQHLLKQLSKSLQVSLGSWVTDAVFRRVWAQQSSTKFLWFVRSAHTHKTSLHSENNAVHLLKNEYKHFYKTGRLKTAWPYWGKNSKTISCGNLYWTKCDFMISNVKQVFKHHKQTPLQHPKPRLLVHGNKALSSLQGKRWLRRAFKHVSSALGISSVGTRLLSYRHTLALSVRKTQIQPKWYEVQKFLL